MFSHAGSTCMSTSQILSYVFERVINTCIAKLMFWLFTTLVTELTLNMSMTKSCYRPNSPQGKCLLMEDVSQSVGLICSFLEWINIAGSSTNYNKIKQSAATTWYDNFSFRFYKQYNCLLNFESLAQHLVILTQSWFHIKPIFVDTFNF